MLKKFLGDKYTRANNIAKSVRSLQRVPEKERPRIVKKAVLKVLLSSSFFYGFTSSEMRLLQYRQVIILRVKRSGQGVPTSICIFLYQFSFQ